MCGCVLKVKTVIIFVCVMSALTPHMTDGTLLQTQEHLMRFKNTDSERFTSNQPSLQTFGCAPSYDEDDDEDDERQEQEGGEDVGQRQEKVVSLLGQDDRDDSR